jgi:hypothetical protein
MWGAALIAFGKLRKKDITLLLQWVLCSLIYPEGVIDNSPGSVSEASATLGIHIQTG